MNPVATRLLARALAGAGLVPAHLLALAGAGLVPARLHAQRLDIPDSLLAHTRARVENGWAPSIIIGVVDASGSRYYAFGATRADGGTPVNERTIYEIGSISKVFTGLVLADLAARGELSLDEPVQRLLPSSVQVPADSGVITLRLLSAHRSGLPRMPNNFRPADPANPYADYDTARLYEFVNGVRLTRAAGARYEYSNVGVGLLGHALARRAGTTWEALLRRRLLDPLRLTSTMQALSAEARSRLAHGSSDGLAAANWELDALAGAGALRSSAEDMTRLLAAAIGLTRTPLDSAFRLADQPLFDAGSEQMHIGLGWHIRRRPGGTLVWHNGGTGGYRSWAGYDQARRAGVVVLTNSTENIDPIGFHALDHSVPLPAVTARPLALSPDSLAAYEGSYQLAPAFILTIRRHGGELRAQATSQPEFRIYASGQDEFFYRVVPARLTFERDAGGRVVAVTLHQNGRTIRGPRL